MRVIDAVQCRDCGLMLPRGKVREPGKVNNYYYKDIQVRRCKGCRINHQNRFSYHHVPQGHPSKAELVRRRKLLRKAKEGDDKAKLTLKLRYALLGIWDDINGEMIWL